MDAAQAMKDMNRERLSLNAVEVSPSDIPRLLSDLIHALLDQALRMADNDLERQQRRNTDAVSSKAVPVEKSNSPGGVPNVIPEVEEPAVVEGSSGGGGGGIMTSPSDGVSAVPRHSRVHASLTEHLVMRTINAASRTTSGGDAFFIVQVTYSTEVDKLVW